MDEGRHAGRGHIPNRVDISERVAIVELKSCIGDFDRDMIVGLGHASGLVTLVDRCSKYICIRRVEDLKASTVCGEIIDALAPYSGSVHTIPFDNGKESFEHRRDSASLGTSVYFATRTIPRSVALSSIATALFGSISRRGPISAMFPTRRFNGSRTSSTAVGAR